MTPKLRVAVITCYKDPDYIRARTLRAALAQLPEVEMRVIKNRSKGVAKYWEVLRELFLLRRNWKPDVYILTFRGYEILPFVLMIAGRKPVVYDEFINPVLVVNEHREQKTGIVRLLMGLWGLGAKLYGLLLKRCRVVLTDTQANGRYSAHASGVKESLYIALPVGADEDLFVPAQNASRGNSFTVFYYGSMVPLHGLGYVIEAAEMLRGRPEITFLLVGGNDKTAARIAQAQKNGAHIEHKIWINFEELPKTIHQAAVCLGGPFGGTTQANLVITGKTYQFLACGAPTIIGRSSASGIFEDRKNCLVVPQASAKALYDTIAWAYEHRSVLPAVGKAGRELYQRHFSVNALSDELKHILSNLNKT